MQRASFDASKMILLNNLNNFDVTLRICAINFPLNKFPRGVRNSRCDTHFIMRSFTMIIQSWIRPFWAISYRFSYSSSKDLNGINGLSFKMMNSSAFVASAKYSINGIKSPYGRGVVINPYGQKTFLNSFMLHAIYSCLVHSMVFITLNMVADAIWLILNGLCFLFDLYRKK